MAQFGRPASDVSTGSWTTTPLWSKIDEVTASDADFAKSSDNPANDVFEVALSSLTDPASSTGHVMRFRERMQYSGGGSPGNITITFSLIQGTTVIASAEFTKANNDLAYYDRELALTGTEANSITDYTDLRLRFRSNKFSGAKVAWSEVTWAELEVPDVPAPALMNVLSRLSEAWKTLTDAATVAIDPKLGHRFYHSGSTGRTFSAPGTDGYDGQQIVIAMKNAGGGDITHTLTTGSAGAFRFGAGITGLTATAAGKTDYITADYQAVDERWDVVGYAKGY
ncbi:MAG TPA: hypothetical protein VMM38_01300 [Aridibacter sp.]|nr:hypothetical protein [Aridibacter sp.]